MVRELFNKVFRKEAKNEKVSKVKDSVTLGPGEYHHVYRPTTASELTIAQIEKFQGTLKNI